MGGCAHAGRSRSRAPGPCLPGVTAAMVPSILRRWISSTKQAHAGDAELATWSGSGVRRVGPLT
jgi:hypothetical protein